MKIFRRIIACLCLISCFLLSACQTAGQNSPEPQETSEQASQSAPLNWNVKTIRIKADTKAEYPYTRWMTSETLKTFLKNDCLSEQEYKDRNEKPETVSYPETFFKTNSLLLIGLSVEGSTTYEVVDVQYRSGVLTCEIERSSVPAGSTDISSISYRGVFVEIDRVLPSTTQVELQFTPKRQS